MKRMQLANWTRRRAVCKCGPSVKTFTAILVAFGIIVILPFYFIFLPVEPLFITDFTDSSRMDSTICEIPEIPLRSTAYNDTVTSVEWISGCNRGRLKLTELFDNGTLKLLRSDLYRRDECTAYEVLRPQKLESDRHELKQLPRFDRFNQIYSIQAEYVMVACGAQTLEYSYHRRLRPSQEPILSKVKYWEGERSELPLNVMVLVLDSTSAADAARHLPLTMNLLRSELNFIQFSKYHALGEPTMVNALPLLTNTPARSLFMDRKWTDYWDDINFIWKDFQNSNYVTAFVEDIPFIGTFNYGFQSGFKNPPTDIYLRPLFTAWEMNKKQYRNCIGDTSLWNFIYDYELEILQTLDGIVPYFTIAWLCWPQHDHFGTLSSLDTDTASFFRDLSSSSSWDNTLVIVMGDHGFYSHAYSSTYEGALERRLPLFLIRIPERLNEQIPNATKLVKENSNRVVTHYDVYETLFHISHLHEPMNNEEPRRGVSLLRPIPVGRTCREAWIPNTWCACNLMSPQHDSENDIPDYVYLRPDGFKLFNLF